MKLSTAIATALLCLLSLTVRAAITPQSPLSDSVLQRHSAFLDTRLKRQGLKLGNPVLIRAFKQEKILELWVFDGRNYELFKSYGVCRISGRLGPKMREGDQQVPEGFYAVDAGALNPDSRFRLSFNIGYPNRLDRNLGRTGGAIMIHGGCASSGCYAMGDTDIDEIFTLVEAALRLGQVDVPVMSFPFRMTRSNMRRHRDNRWMPFWRQLKAGYDAFEKHRMPPRISVVEGEYLILGTF
jgi:murein L,D-transpeptidase YafK